MACAVYIAPDKPPCTLVQAFVVSASHGPEQCATRVAQARCSSDDVMKFSANRYRPTPHFSTANSSLVERTRDICTCGFSSNQEITRERRLVYVDGVDHVTQYSKFFYFFLLSIIASVEYKYFCIIFNLLFTVVEFKLFLIYQTRYNETNLIMYA